MNEIISKLSEKLSKEAIQRTKGIQTKKGYDTDGYGYQHVVDRFNDILGEAWGFDWNIIHEKTGQYKNGMPYFDITVQVSIWINDKNNSRSCAGGHTAISFSDALKGAITNGFKKTAGFWGVGRDAFAGTIDDDNQPLPDTNDNKDMTQKVKDEFNGTELTGADIMQPDQEVIKEYWKMSPDDKKKIMPHGYKATKIDNKWYVKKVA